MKLVNCAGTSSIFSVFQLVGGVADLNRKSVNYQNVGKSIERREQPSGTNGVTGTQALRRIQNC